MSRLTVIALVSLLALISAALFLVGVFAAPRPPLPPLPTGKSTAMVSFIGYTNAVFQYFPRQARTSETCATFRLINATGRRIAYRAESIETWTPTGWQTTTLRCTPTNWYGFGAVLASGETRVFHVPQPAAERWRVRLTCTEKAMGLQRAKDWVADYRSNRNPANRGVEIESFSGFIYQIVSPEVQP